jgi:hypothetical protein
MRIARFSILTQLALALALASSPSAPAPTQALVRLLVLVRGAFV